MDRPLVNVDDKGIGLPVRSHPVHQPVAIVPAHADAAVGRFLAEQFLIMGELTDGFKAVYALFDTWDDADPVQHFDLWILGPTPEWSHVGDTMTP